MGIGIGQNPSTRQSVRMCGRGGGVVDTTAAVADGTVEGPGRETECCNAGDMDVDLAATVPIDATVIPVLLAPAAVAELVGV